MYVAHFLPTNEIVQVGSVVWAHGGTMDSWQTLTGARVRSAARQAVQMVTLPICVFKQFCNAVQGYVAASTILKDDDAVKQQ